MGYSMDQDREARATGTSQVGASPGPLQEKAQRVNEELSAKGINTSSQEAEELKQTGASPASGMAVRTSCA